LEAFITILSKSKIFNLLQKVDAFFMPLPLSERVNLLDYAEKLSELSIHFVIKKNNEIIGMTCCYMNNLEQKVAFISIICIVPNQTGIGLGKILTLKSENNAKSLGFSIIESEVHKKNIPSIKMYKKLGYHIDREREDYYYMNKNLR
jgi:ribosomal protein S18 acetylase RimI-like enzyme